MNSSISEDIGTLGLEKTLQKHLGDDGSNIVMLAVESLFSMPPMTRETIAGDDDTVSWIKFPPLRAAKTGFLDFDKVEDMLRTGEIAHPLAMKKAPIISIVSAESGFTVKSADERLGKFMEANLADALPRAIDEILTHLEYGAYYGEVTWEPIYPQDYGLLKSSIPFWGISSFHGCHPNTIDEIKRNEDTKRFEGFVQRVGMDRTTVGLNRAFIISNDGLFGDLGGTSVLEPVYLWWFWYELIWRAFLRYLQRCGVGVVAVRAPNRSKVKVAGSMKDSMDWALHIASSLHRTNYAVIPSDTDPETGQPLWAVEYLKGSDREGDQFIKALELLGGNIRQHLLTGSPEQKDTGEFQIMLDTERVLANIGKHLDRYVLRKAVLWNGSSSRKLSAAFQGANTTVLPLLFKLMAVAGNTAGSALRNVDWRQLMTRGGVPVLDEEEVEKLRKQEEREREPTDPFGRTRKQYEEARKPVGGEGRWASERDKKGEIEKFEMMYDLLKDALNADIVPLSKEQHDELERLGLLGDDSVITLFNPYHDVIGRFTDKAHAKKPLPKGLYYSHGFVGPITDFRVKDATSLAYEKMGQKPVEVHVYDKWADYMRSIRAGDELEKSERREQIKHGYGAYMGGKIHISPRGAKAIRERRKFGEYLILHEARHSRRRSDGSYEADLRYRKKDKEAKFMASGRKILEEGTVDLLSRRDLGLTHRTWLKDYNKISRFPYMGAVALLVAAASGWDRARAWQIIDRINYRINDNESIWEVLYFIGEALGEPVGGWNGKNLYALLVKLQIRAAASGYRELGWLFGGGNER